MLSATRESYFQVPDGFRKRIEKPKGKDAHGTDEFLGKEQLDWL